MRSAARTDFRSGRRRPGAAAAELALLLPLLLFLVVVAVDFARLFYHYVTITNCARNGALYASDAFSPLRRTYTDYQQAALADGQSLNPPLTTSQVTFAKGLDAYGNYVEVKVRYAFPMITSYLGFSTVNIQRTVRMREAPNVPN